VALPAPSDREKTQIYAQRYLAHFPAAGEVVIFDRSWYNRAGVEKVMGFCTEEQHRKFLEMAPAFEKNILVDNGIILLKYWLEVGDKEQERRFARASKIRCGSGSSPRWTCPRASGGMTIRARATRCSMPPTRTSRPGMWCTPMTRSGRA